MRIERRWSAPAGRPEWQDYDVRWSEATLEDYSACSESEAEQRYEDSADFRTLTRYGPKPVQDFPHCCMSCSHDVCEAYVFSSLDDATIREHECIECTGTVSRRRMVRKATAPAVTDRPRLGQYAREICSMMQGALSDLVGSGVEPFPVYTDVAVIEGIHPTAPQQKRATKATKDTAQVSSHLQDHQDSSTDDDHNSVTQTYSVDLQSLSVTGTSSLGAASPFSGSNDSDFTRPSSTDFTGIGRPTADPLAHRRVRRMEACYFGASEDLRDTDGEPLITNRARDIKDV